MQSSAAEGDKRSHMVFVEGDSFRNLRRLPTDAFRSIPRLPREALPVAASDLVAWYPFRSGTGEDITAGDSNFGDTTDYSASVNGATFQASGGVTDIQTGPNSGVFDFDGVDDGLTATLPTFAQLSICVWVNWDNLNSDFLGPIDTLKDANGSGTHQFTIHADGGGTDRIVCITPAGRVTFTTVTAGEWFHLAATYDGTTVTTYVNGTQANTGTGSFTAELTEFGIGRRDSPKDFDVITDGRIDDVRIYDSALSDSQINQIYLNTEP